MSPNLLVTKRMINSSLGLLLSGILGSVAGLLAAIGKAMSVSETSMGIVKKKINSKEHLRKLKNRRMLLALDENENENKTEEEIKTPQTLDFIKIDFNYS